MHVENKVGSSIRQFRQMLASTCSKIGKLDQHKPGKVGPSLVENIVKFYVRIDFEAVQTCLPLVYLEILCYLSTFKEKTTI